MISPCWGCLKLRNACILIGAVAPIQTCLVISILLSYMDDINYTSWEFFLDTALKVISIVCACLLTIGAYIENKWLLVPYIIYACTDLCFYYATSIVPIMQGELLLLRCLSLVVLSAFYIYIGIIVVAYFVELHTGVKKK